MSKKIIRWPTPIQCAHCHQDIPKLRTHYIVHELGAAVCADCWQAPNGTQPIHTHLFPDCHPWHDMYDHKSISATSRDLAATAMTYFVPDTVRWAPHRDHHITTERTAAELVLLGECSGPCLVAQSAIHTCACVCAGAHHGALSDALVTTQKNANVS